MSWLALCSSFEYVCYGSKDIRNISFHFFQCGIIFIRQNLTSTDVLALKGLTQLWEDKVQYNYRRSPNCWLYMSESDVYRRQIRTYKVSHITERVDLAL